MEHRENPFASPKTSDRPLVEAKDAGEYAPCPNCQGTSANKRSFTWWGGAFGPWLLTHVKCIACGRAYNGKTGNSNTRAIWVYQAVSLAIVLGFLSLLYLL